MSVRDDILQATLELCAARGIAATSVQDIADASGCSKANVLYHFPHKEDLLGEALAPSLTATEALVTAAEKRGLHTVEDRVTFAKDLVELLVAHRLATHIVITHPYFVTTIPALDRAHTLMSRLADAVSTQTSGELDRVRFGIVISGVTYTLVSATILEVQSVPEEELLDTLTSAVTSMLVGSASSVEVSD